MLLKSVDSRISESISYGEIYIVWLISYSVEIYYIADVVVISGIISSLELVSSFVVMKLFF